MYSLVLMMALSNGAATPTWHDGEDHHSVSHYGDNIQRQYRNGGWGCGGGCYGGGCYGGGCCGGGCYGGGCYGGGCYGGGYMRGYGGRYMGGYGYATPGMYSGGYAYGSTYNGYGSPRRRLFGRSSGGYAYGSTYDGSSYPRRRLFGRSAYSSSYGENVYPPSYGGYMSGYPVEEGAVVEPMPPEGGRERVLPPSEGGRIRERIRDRDRDGERGIEGEKKKSERESPEGQVRTAAPARLVVTLPADARLTIDDTPTSSQSSTRVFVSPSLQPGVEYAYTLKAEVVRGGQRVTTTKRISVRAGEETRVQLDLPASGVAQR
jgi:uncharacterized protein (TIGR03000 family)